MIHRLRRRTGGINHESGKPTRFPRAKGNDTNPAFITASQGFLPVKLRLHQDRKPDFHPATGSAAVPSAAPCARNRAGSALTREALLFAHPNPYTPLSRISDRGNRGPHCQSFRPKRVSVSGEIALERLAFAALLSAPGHA